jgi:hypothetical protein
MLGLDEGKGGRRKTRWEASLFIVRHRELKPAKTVTRCAFGVIAPVRKALTPNTTTALRYFVPVSMAKTAICGVWHQR